MKQGFVCLIPGSYSESAVSGMLPIIYSASLRLNPLHYWKGTRRKGGIPTPRVPNAREVILEHDRILLRAIKVIDLVVKQVSHEYIITFKKEEPGPSKDDGTIREYVVEVKNAPKGGWAWETDE